MRKSLLAILACGVALASLAQGVYQPMASKALLERRVSEVSSNMTAKIAELQQAIEASASNLMAAVKLATVPEASRRSQQTSGVLSEILGDVFADNPNRGLRVSGPLGDGTINAFLAHDGTERTPACYTNALYDVACWETAIVSGDTTNYTYVATTGSGERFEQTACMTNALNEFVGSRYTLSCTTNSARALTLVGVDLSDVARKLILSAE